MAEGAASTDNITLRVKDQHGNETFFKVKKTTKMEKVFKAYAQRRGVPPNTLRFLVDGERVANSETPKTLELQDQDQSEYLRALEIILYDLFVRFNTSLTHIYFRLPAKFI